MKKIIIYKKRPLILEVTKPRSDKIVIISHGFLSNKNKLFLQRIASSLSRLGIGSVRFNYGTELISERLSKLRRIIEEFKDKSIGLMGESLGGMVSIIASSEQLVKSIALVNTVYNQEMTFKNYISRHKLLSKLMTNSIGRNFFSYNLDLIVKRLKKPVIVISGSRDEITNTRDLKRLYLDIKSKKKLVILRDCGHSIWAPQHVKRSVDEISHWFKSTL